MENKNPLVSIVVITYNSSDFILEALESCKNQTYKNIELIISDDCSTDNTVKKCREWLSNYTNRFERAIIIETKKNTGISANLNRGVNATRANWFKLTAGDDLLLNNCIEDNVNFILSSKEDINIVSSIKISFTVDSNGKKFFFSSGEKSVFFNKNITPEDQYQLALRHISPTPNTWFLKKKAFVDVGGCDERFPMIEDIPLKLKLLIAGNKFYRLDTKTVLYRVHNKSVRIKSSDNLIYKDWFLNSLIPMKYTYVYPHISRIEKLIFKYDCFIAMLFVKINLNKRNKLNLILNKLFILPSEMIYKYIRNRIRNHFSKKKASEV